MHPAFSVILFTTLSGSGFGLLSWIGLQLLSQTTPLPRTPLLLCLVLGMVLAAVGLGASLWHLGQPQRAWRAFSQWRSSWLSREGVIASLSFAPALALLWLAWSGTPGNAGRWLGAALLLCSVTTVICTAMIYASLPPIAAWRDRNVVPVYMGYALLGGVLWCTMLLNWCGWHPGLPEHAPALMLVAVLGALKLDYWRRIDALPLSPDAASATGLTGFGEVRSFEAPNTEQNYLQREMGFVLARKHARRLRPLALIVGLLLPALLLLVAGALPIAGVVLSTLAVLAFQLGAMLERWLFFAQARHTVMLYYNAGSRSSS